MPALSSGLFLINKYYVVYVVFLLFSWGSFLVALYVYMWEMSLFLEWEVLCLNSISVVYTLLLDWVSALFCSVVLFISSMVMLYSYSYMSLDKSPLRFIILVVMFVVSMLLMVLSPNMISILLGWDGLGLVSYGLVIYYQNMKSAGAGMVTILSNRLGDIAILVSISWLFNYGSWDFFYLQYMVNDSILLTLVLLIVFAGMTKSAQIPFSAWLPAAMAAPTPVSALVHSSTLVTAGVYLLIRFHKMLGVSLFLMYVSVLTLFMSGLGAVYECDLKKVIALSTLSQLGVMMFSLSVGLWELAFFHLISHATFKSLLFLCAGVYIHSFNDTQDMRGLGMNIFSYPVAGIYFIGCSLSICGFPFLAGFYSKDLVLEMFFNGKMPIFSVILLVMGVMFTVVYSVRLMNYVYIKGSGISPVYGTEGDVWTSGPMSGLFMMSLIIGGVYVWLFIPPLLMMLTKGMKLLVLILSLLVFMVTYKNYTSWGGQSVKKFEVLMKYFLGMMWFIPMMTSSNPMGWLMIGKIYFKTMDSGWLEMIGGQGAMYSISSVSVMVDKWGVTHLKLYLFTIFVVLVWLFLL